MNEALTPKQLAAIKMNARKVRIRNIRRRVAISVATVSALFSGIILVGALNQQSQTSTTSIASTRTFDSSQQTAATSQAPVTAAPTTTTPTAPPVTTSQS